MRMPRPRVRYLRTLGKQPRVQEIAVPVPVSAPVAMHEIMILVFNAQIIPPEQVAVAVVHIHKHIDRITFRFIAVNNPCMTSVIVPPESATDQSRRSAFYRPH